MTLSGLLVADAGRYLSRHPRKKFDPIPFEPIRTHMETVDCRAAQFVPEQLERVVACGFSANLSSEIEKLEATCWEESPTFHCVLENATVLGGEIFTSRARHFLSAASPYKAALGRTTQYQDVSIPNSLQGLKYFGHWLRDDCASYELLREEGHEIASLGRPTWADCQAYETRFDQVWEERTAFRATRLYVVREIGFNLDKKRRLEALRGRVRSEAGKGGIFYIRRGQSGMVRSIVNEDELLEGLAAYGVTVLEPEAQGKAVLDACLDADLVITIEGSQAAHALYALKDGGSLLILQPPDRFYNPHVEWTRMLGMRYGIVVGEPAEGGMQIHLDEVLAMSERLIP